MADYTGTFTSNSPEETQQIAKQLAAELRAGDVVLLLGELGAGKTCFVRGLAEGLGCDPDLGVRSPTYAIRHDYRGPVTLVHIDIYRTGEEILSELSLDEVDDAVFAIEWLESPPAFGNRVFRVEIEDPSPDVRKLAVSLQRGTAT